MALLDGFVGDDTIKDEYGQTQADRREPLWGGLIKAGLLGIAAGGNLMPADRAKYMAQMGGAISDIPEDMQKRQSAAAQAMLRGQQIAEGKQKVANKAKLAEYAKSPEFQAAMQKLDPSRRMLAQAALDAGDVDAAVKVVHGQDTSELAQQRLEISRQRNDLTAAANANLADKREADIRRQAEELKIKQDAEARKAAEEKPMTPGRAWNIVNGAANKPADDPIFSSPEYKAARTLLENPHTGTDAVGQKIDLPGFDLSYLPPATFKHPAAGEPQSREPKVLPGQAQKPLGDDTVKAITGALTVMDTADELKKELAANPDIKIGSAANQILDRFGGTLGKDWLDKNDPKGQRARTLIDNLAAERVHQLSGAAVTPQEFARLVRYIPQTTDSPEQLRKKIDNFQREYDIILKARHEQIPQNAIVPEALEKRYGKPKSQGGTGSATSTTKPKTFNPATGEFED